jgi:hypothetical protein
MTNTTNPQELCERIESLVQEYISATCIAAHAALQRAFGSGGMPKPKSAPTNSRRARARVRRASTEIAALGERLYEAVCKMPGETMMALGPVVGASARELNRPMTQLKRAGRVRSVGTRHTTRYFPMARGSSPST